jgi:hypothetical protein
MKCGSRSTYFAILLMLVPALALAHHSGAIYDMNQTVTIEGTVTRYDWANPHVYVHIEQVTDAGEVVEWAVEAYPPAQMRRVGWTDTTLQPGDLITVTGRPTRRTNNRGILPGTIEAAGQVLFQPEMMRQLTSANMLPEVGASSLEGTWETITNWKLIMLFYSGAEVTEAGSEARASYDETTMLPGWDCIPYTAPMLMYEAEFKQIIVEEDVVTIRGGFAPADRTVYMNIDTHDGAVPSLQGHSIGHWEGATLVIDTASFAPSRTGNGYRGTASGLQKHLIERLTLVDDGKKLSYSFELTDPEFLAQTVTGTSEWAYRPDLEFVREICELDNARGGRSE